MRAPARNTGSAGSPSSERTNYAGLGFSVIGAVGIWMFVALAATSLERWNRMNIWFTDPRWPMFMDLRALWQSLGAWAHGIDPLSDPGTAFNYPRIWLSLSRIGVQDLPFLPSALVLDALFLICVALWLRPTRWWEGLLAAAIFWSPPMRLILERANIDLVLFLTIGAGAACSARLSGRVATAWIAPAIMAIAALLKVYPMVVLFAGFWLGGGCIRSRRWWLWASLIVALVFCVHFREMIAIGNKTLQSDTCSFGVTVLGMRIYNHSFGHGLDEPQVVATASRAISTAVFAALAFAAYRRGIGWRPLFSDAAENPNWAAFWISAAVYTGTFALGANFSYRLVFILMGIPFLLHVSRESGGSRARWAKSTLVVVVFVLFAPLVTRGAPYFLIQVLQWALALLLVAGIAAMAPGNQGNKGQSSA